MDILWTHFSLILFTDSRETHYLPPHKKAKSLTFPVRLFAFLLWKELHCQLQSAVSLPGIDSGIINNIQSDAVSLSFIEIVKKILTVFTPDQIFKTLTVSKIHHLPAFVLIVHNSKFHSVSIFSHHPCRQKQKIFLGKHRLRISGAERFQFF